MLATTFLLGCLLVLSFGLTSVVRRYALSNQLIDIPNDRSSHNLQTPRGGGLAIVISVLLGLAICSILGSVSAPLFTAVLFCGGLVALVGFVDDHRHLPALFRLLVHFAAATVAVLLLGGVPALDLGSFTLSQWYSNPVAIFFIVWMINLYNFMDGIDAIASLEAITVCFGVAVAGLLVSADSDAWLPPSMLLAAVAGFLPWNWQPARIFMGDVGSGFIGFVLAVFSVHSLQLSVEVFAVWLIMLGVFICDATVTLLTRAIQRERILDAHRSHAYQYAARWLGEHRRVSNFVAAVNLFWLMPLSLLVVVESLSAPLAIAIAYTPLIVLALCLGAGKRENAG